MNPKLPHLSGILHNSAKLAGISILLGSLLMACSSAPNPEESDKDDSTSGSKSASSISESASGGDEDLTEKSETSKAEKSIKAEPKSSAKSTACVPTKKMVDGFEFIQQNEFLGATTTKISKLGVRIESPTITCILPLGKSAMAYNSQNGSCLQLTHKSTSMLAGGLPSDGSKGKDHLEKLGKDKIAGINCIHYDYSIEMVDPRSKSKSYEKHTEIWGTKEIKVPPAVLKDCSKILMMPPEVGFPIRILRIANPAELEKRRKNYNPSGKREAITTSSYKATKFDEGEFAPLQGFKPVTDEMQFMMSGDDTELAGGGSLDELDKEPPP